jgi:hypothetical protein
MNDDELTPYEKKALQSLPKERMPRAELEDRVVGALQRRGVLRPRGRRYFELTPFRMAAAVAACLVLILGGFGFGRWSASQGALPAGTTLQTMDDLSVAASLQQAGTAYVLALEKLASLAASGSNGDLLQGREVALTTLYTATDQVTKIVPGNYLAAQLLQTIDLSGSAKTGEQGIERQRAVWF